MRNPLKIELYLDRKRDWRVRLSRSGRRMFASTEGYSSAAKARKSFFSMLSAIEKGHFVYENWR